MANEQKKGCKHPTSRKGNWGEVLTKQERKALEVFVNNSTTKTEASVLLGIGSHVLDRVLLSGTARIENIQKIRSVIAVPNAATKV